MVKQYAALAKTPSTDRRAPLRGAQASRLCWAVKRASRTRSMSREPRTEPSCSATDHGMESKVRKTGSYSSQINLKLQIKSEILAHQRYIR